LAVAVAVQAVVPEAVNAVAVEAELQVVWRRYSFQRFFYPTSSSSLPDLAELEVHRRLVAGTELLEVIAASPYTHI
jgi:hypothetical protein